MHPQNKMLGSDPILFSDLFDFFLGVPAPSFSSGTPNGCHIYTYLHIRE